MRLGWDEIKRRARAFSEEWRDAHYEKGETQSFYNDVLDIFDARAAHPTASLADLYDPDTMPADLRRAHHALDVAVDKLYRPLHLRPRPR